MHLLKIEFTQEELSFILRCIKTHRESQTHPDERQYVAKLAVSISVKMSNATKVAYAK